MRTTRLIALFIAAATVRGIYLWHNAAYNPFFDTLIIDMEWFDEAAMNIVSGGAWSTEMLFRGPLYPHLLAFLYNTFGHSYLFPRMVQHLLGLGTLLLVIYLAHRLFDQRTAFVAGLIYAFYGTVILYEGELLIVTLYTFLLVSFIVLTLRIRHSPPIFSALAGGFLGLAAMARPNILCLILVVIPYLVPGAGRVRGTRVGLQRGAFFMLGLVLALLPLTIKYYRLTGELIIVSSQGGLNFYLGNNPLADGWNTVIPGLGTWRNPDVQRITDRELDHHASPGEISTHWLKKGLLWLGENPGKALELYLRKICLLATGYEIKNNMNLYHFASYSWLLSLLMWDRFGISFPWGIVFPLGMVGLLLKLPGGANEVRMLRCVLLVYMLFMLPFFICGRYRIPLVPLMVIFSARFLLWLLERVKGGNYNHAIISLLVVFTLMYISNADLCGARIRDDSQVHYDLGNIYQRKGDMERAIFEYEKAIQERPAYPNALFNLGNIYTDLGDYNQAIIYYKRAVDYHTTFSDALVNLGMALTKKGRIREAIDYLKRAIDSGENQSAAYNNLGIAYLRMEDYDKALECFEKAFSLEPSNINIRLNIARIYELQGKLGAAMDKYMEILRQQPQNQAARRRLRELRGF